jgi:hypothetical protein
MSLPLSGQAGFAQFGLAQAGQLASDALVGAGFPIFFPDSGPRKDAEPPKKKKAKKPKKVKKPKKAKREKKPKPTIEARRFTPPVVKDTWTVPDALVRDIVTVIQAVDTAERQLRETITEDDELLLMVLCNGNG